MSRDLFYIKGSLWLVLLALLVSVFSLLVSACSSSGQPAIGSPTEASPSAPAAPDAASVEPSATTPPSPTPAALAAQVGETGILLAQYEHELDRYQAGLDRELTPDEQEMVLNELIAQTLLAQAAAEEGFVLAAADLESRLVQLQDQAGGAQALKDWLAAHSYTEETFRADLARSAAAAWMRDRILEGVAAMAEQVHARQILAGDAAAAEEALLQLGNGRDFAQLAAEYDPVTEGELGWFPRGYLLDPALEEAAFSLNPGEYSQVIATAAGFHILQVIEREPERPLEPDARLALESRTLQTWLEKRRSETKIEIRLP